MKLPNSKPERVSVIRRVRVRFCAPVLTSMLVGSKLNSTRSGDARSGLPVDHQLGRKPTTDQIRLAERRCFQPGP